MRTPKTSATMMLFLLLLLSVPRAIHSAGDSTSAMIMPTNNEPIHSHRSDPSDHSDHSDHSGRTDKRHRKMPDAEQNMCGSDWTQAQQCLAYCPGGTNEECPPGQQCLAGVMCPLPPTISPAPTRSPVKGYDIGNHDKSIVGYYASWQWYDRAKLAKPQNMDFRKVTRVNYAFFQLDATGNIWGTDEWADPRVLWGEVNANAGSCGPGSPLCRCSWISETDKQCNYHLEEEGLIYLAHHAGAEIYPSIGGWTLSEPYSPMAKDPTSRAKFVANCVGLIKDYGFDGIDLDWEYPGYADHGGNPWDTESLNELLKELRAALDNLEQETGKFYGLTCALPCGPSHINNIDIPTVSQYLTEFNLMTYDFHGSWDLKTGVNSPLYDQSGDPESGWSVDGCVKNWVDRGAPKDRLNIGLGFYGRSFKNAKGLGETHGGNDDANWEIDEGTPQYFNIYERLNEMTSVRDEETKTQIAYFADGGMVSYDDEQSICDKAQYALDESLNGFIIWELSGDVLKDTTTPLLDILNRKIVETDTNCADPFGTPLSTKATSASTAKSTTTAARLASTTTAEPELNTGESTSSTSTTSTTTWAATTTSTTATTTTTSSSSATIASTDKPPATFMSVSVSDTTTSSTKSASATAAAVVQMARKPVKRNKHKPEKPYRPPREEVTDEL